MTIAGFTFGVRFARQEMLNTFFFARIILTGGFWGFGEGLRMFQLRIDKKPIVELKFES